MRPAKTRKIGAVVLTVVMLLMQFAQVSPGLARTLRHRTAAVHCTGDHALCGCSPERIASRTCCCFRTKRLPVAEPETPPCCRKSAAMATCSVGAMTQPDQEQADAGDEDRSTPAISSIPCGSLPGFIPVALEDALLFHPKIEGTVQTAATAEHPATGDDSFTSRSPAPPDPPPKLSPPAVHQFAC